MSIEIHRGTCSTRAHFRKVHKSSLAQECCSTEAFRRRATAVLAFALFIVPDPRRVGGSRHAGVVGATLSTATTSRKRRVIGLA